MDSWIELVEPLLVGLPPADRQSLGDSEIGPTADADLVLLRQHLGTPWASIEQAPPADLASWPSRDRTP